MEIYVVENGEERPLKSNEVICPDCKGRGWREESTNEDIKYRMKVNKPTPFDLDCCMTCHGHGVMDIEFHKVYGFVMVPKKESEL